MIVRMEVFLKGVRGGWVYYFLGNILYLPMGGREVGGYKTWFLKNTQESPLYPKMQSTSSGDAPIGG